MDNPGSLFKADAQQVVEGAEYACNQLVRQGEWVLWGSKRRPYTKAVSKHMETIQVEFWSYTERGFVNCMNDIKYIWEQYAPYVDILMSLEKKSVLHPENMPPFVDVKKLIKAPIAKELNIVKTKFKESVSNVILALYDKCYLSGNIEYENTKTLILSRKPLHSKHFKTQLGEIMGIKEITSIMKESST